GVRTLSISRGPPEARRRMEPDPHRRQGRARGALAERRQAARVRAVERRLDREGRGDEVQRMAEVRPRQTWTHRPAGRPRGLARLPQHSNPRGAVMSDNVSRRKFVTDVGIATAGLTIVPRHVLGKGQTAPSDKMHLACVGVGGQGRSNLINASTENIVALADVDWDYANAALGRLDGDIARTQRRLDATPENPIKDSDDKPLPMLTPLERTRSQAEIEGMRRLQAQLPKAKKYQDYREMLDREKSIDGVIVATPDHMHALIALAAMDLGKHVYVQKPLCWSVSEARQLARRARETKVTTQMGNQGHSWDD